MRGFESGGGSPQSPTLARWPRPRKREASWSAPALWRFGPSLVLPTNVRIPNSTGRRPLRFLVYGCFIRSCRPMSLKALAKVATSVTRLSGRHLSGNKRFLAVFSGMRWWVFPSWGSLFQSQRDCIHQPWVARNELPRVSGTEFKTLKGLDRLLSRWDTTPSGLKCIMPLTQGRPSPSRANLGLNDPIPLGLKQAHGGHPGKYRVPLHCKQRGTFSG